MMLEIGPYLQEAIIMTFLFLLIAYFMWRISR